VLEQVINVSRSMVVQDAWQRGQELTIHGWIYGLKDGLMRDLGLTLTARRTHRRALRGHSHAHLKP
jgi:carbonic anhydrase